MPLADPRKMSRPKRLSHRLDRRLGDHSEPRMFTSNVRATSLSVVGQMAASVSPTA
jgi:hypothetical protein